MPNIKSWISAARLRTLPLSISGIIVGSSLGFVEPLWESSIFWLAIVTTIGFQVLSNFANDYGDGIKGTDQDRVGEQRLVASGIISPKQMIRAMVLTAIATLLIAIILIYKAFGNDHFLLSLLFFGLGLVSIIAAIKYTVGNKAYGYSGFGDVFVFLFFGLLSVCGSYFLYTKQLNVFVFLPAASIGMLSAGVLNLNNMRDRISDEKSGKNTLVVKIGDEFAKYYHYYLIVGSFLFALLFVMIHFESAKQFLFVIAYVPIFKHLITVYKNKNPQELDPELKKLALSTFLFSVLLGVGFIF